MTSFPHRTRRFARVAALGFPFLFWYCSPAPAREFLAPQPPDEPVVTFFSLSPGTDTVSVDEKVQLSVVVTWSDGKNHPFDVSFTADGGTVSEHGLYTAGSTPGVYRVVARCTCGPADTSMIAVTAVAATLLGLTLTPPDTVLAPGAAAQFAVTASWSDGSEAVPEVTFVATGGAITPDGRYRAGSAPGSYQVIAAYQGDDLADTSSVVVATPTLRGLAGSRGLAVGAAVNIGALRNDSAYRRTLALEYNAVVPERVMMFGPIHPAPNQYAFTAADDLVAFAETHGMTIHGHALVWHLALPTWLTGRTFTKVELLSVLKDHIRTIVGRYRGKIASWDVVNEPISETAGVTYRRTIWLQTIGPEYIDSAFAWAHRADPDAKLYLNDYGTEAAWKATELLTLAQSLRARGLVVHGIGFQSHFTLEPPSASVVRGTFARFANAGFEVRVSELDVQVPDAAGPDALVEQARIYRDVLDACLGVSRCRGFTTWGFTDRYSWLPLWYPGFGRGLPFDASYQPKPAYHALIERLQQP